MTPTIEQEPDRVPRGLIRFSGALIGIMIVASVGATLLLGRGGLGEATPLRSQPPVWIDRELFRVETEAERLTRAGRERLKTFGWVDRSRGIIHVPLEVAIESYLEEASR